MNAHFLRIFEYDHQSSLLILATINKAGNPQRAIDLMAHLLTARQIWLSRCRNEKLPVSTLWPKQSAEEIQAGLVKVQAGWHQYLHSLDEEDFARRVHYQTSSGQAFENSLTDILAHVVNHGTHHRAQAGEYLRAIGFEGLPPTDYILYVRESEQA